MSGVKKVSTFDSVHLFIWRDWNMLAVSHSNRLTAMIAAVSPLAVRVERFFILFWLLCSAVLSREYFTEASVRNFPKQCTRQSKQWVVTIRRAMWFCAEEACLSFDCRTQELSIFLTLCLIKFTVGAVVPRSLGSGFTSNLNLPSCLSPRLTRG